MIAHVAEASENRGRVIVFTARGRPGEGALAAGVWIARAFKAAIEAVVVDDPQVAALARFGFVREVAPSGGVGRRFATAAADGEHGRVASAARRRIEAVAVAAGVPVQARVVTADPMAALAAACHAAGPWNAVVLADPFDPLDAGCALAAIEAGAPATALLLAAARAQVAAGPIVLAIEDAAHAQPMLRAAQSLARVDGRGIEIMLLAPDAGQRATLDAHARLSMGATAGAQFVAAEPTRGAIAALAETLRRRRPGLVIAAARHAAAPDAPDRGLVAMLDCPVLIVR